MDIDSVFESNNKPKKQNNLKLTSSALDPKLKSRHRLKYEAQVKVIREQLGSLEDIRQSLGLSRRKICQLLMVDPSAWTRWTRRGDDAPPHIYRSLQWYMAINDKFPGLGNPYWLSSVAHGSISALQVKPSPTINSLIEKHQESSLASKVDSPMKHNQDPKTPSNLHEKPRILEALFTEELYTQIADLQDALKITRKDLKYLKARWRAFLVFILIVPFALYFLLK